MEGLAHLVPGAGLIQAEALPGKESASVLALGALEFEGAQGYCSPASSQDCHIPMGEGALCLLTSRPPVKAPHYLLGQPPSEKVPPSKGHCLAPI